MNEQTPPDESKAAVGQSALNVGLGLPKPDTNVSDIVFDWLKLNGFDGLVNDDDKCGCHLDDWMLCGGCGEVIECRPAYKHTKRNGEWWMHTNKHWKEPDGDDA